MSESPAKSAFAPCRKADVPRPPGCRPASPRRLCFAARAANIFFAVPAAFTPCAAGVSLLEKNSLTAKHAARSDVISFSQACSSFDQFRNPSDTDGVFHRAAEGLADAISGIGAGLHPKMQTTGDHEFAGVNRIEHEFLSL